MSVSAPLFAAPLWMRARAMFARARAALGGPAAIAALRVLHRAVRREIIGWLAPLESIARKLLLAEAAAIQRAHAQTNARAPRMTCIALAASGMARHAMQTFPSPRGEGVGGGVNLCASTARGAEARSETTAHHPAHQSPPLTGRGGANLPARFALATPHDPLRVAARHVPHIRQTLDARAAHTARTPNATAHNESARLARRFEALAHVLADPLPYARWLARVLLRARSRFPEIAIRYAGAPSGAATNDHEDPRLIVESFSAAFDAAPVFTDSS